MEYLEEVREKLLMVCLVQFQSVCHSEGCETSGNGKLIWFAEGYYMRRRLSSASVVAFGHRLSSRMSQVGGEGAALASQKDRPQSLFDSYIPQAKQPRYICVWRNCTNWKSDIL